MLNAIIYDAVRTPRGRGRADGSLYEVSSLRLASQVLAALRSRNDLQTSAVDDIVFGIGAPCGEQGSDLPRSAALHAGYDPSVCALQVHRFCASGLDACNIAAAKVKSGEAAAVIAGGVESMSRVPMASDGVPMMTDPAAAFPAHFIPQGVAADLIATIDGFSREVVDRYAVESQRRAAMAWREGRFAHSIVPVTDVLGQPLLATDEHMRANTTLQTLSTLKPSFEEMGTSLFDGVARNRYPMIDQMVHVHHAGNSAGIVDGAAALLVGNQVFGAANGLLPRARILGTASVGADPCIMLTGPEVVARKLLARAGLSAQDIDIWELNEAFASVVLRFIKVMDIDPERMNVNGGAIAMGHPIGATGAMIMGTALDELERRKSTTAMVLLCAAGGQASAAIIERI